MISMNTIRCVSVSCQILDTPSIRCVGASKKTNNDDLWK